MTNNEAIRTLKANYPDACFEQLREAVDVAINALTALLEKTQLSEEDATSDCISRKATIDALRTCYDTETITYINGNEYIDYDQALEEIEQLPSAQPDIEKICTRIKAEAIKRNVEYMKHGDRYMLGFVDGMRLARRIVDGTIDDPVYFTLSGE